jgi:HTH-type transcriptional regulator/antitoxin HigA
VQTLRALYSFFGVAGRKQLEARFKEYTAVAYRQSAAFPVNEGALCAWLRKGEIEAAKLTCSPFSSTKLRRLVSRWRSLTGKHLGTIYPKLRATAADSGIAIVLLPELSGSHTSGAVRWLKGTKQALIQLSLRYATDDLFWFNLFHEVGHLLLHSKDGDVVEDLSPQAVKEEEANRFAADQLIPPESYRQFLLGGNFDRGAIRDFADQIQIAPSIVLGRLQHDRKLQYNQYNDLKLDYKEQYKSRGT